jgi:hypothetical protein
VYIGVMLILFIIEVSIVCGGREIVARDKERRGERGIVNNHKLDNSDELCKQKSKKITYK